ALLRRSRSTLCPYATLFRSGRGVGVGEPAPVGYRGGSGLAVSRGRGGGGAGKAPARCAGAYRGPRATHRAVSPPRSGAGCGILRDRKSTRLNSSNVKSSYDV